MGIRILTWLLALLFIAGGVPKLIGIESVAEQFRQFGYPDWFRLFIGLAELAGGIGLLIPGLVRLAAMGLMVIMLGAAWTLWHVGQPPIPPLVVGAMLAARLGLGGRSET